MRFLPLVLVLLLCAACEPMMLEYPAATPPPPVYPPPPPPPMQEPEPAPVVAVADLGDDVIVGIYVDLFDREPSRDELSRCHERVRARHWGRDQLVIDLRASDEYRARNPDDCVRRIWRDLAHEEPDGRTVQYYSRCMAEQGWTPGQVRQAIRNSDRFRGRQADVIIERAYRDLLERAPDPAGRDNYRRRIEQGWSEEQVRASIRSSVEYRVDLPDAKTKRAYLNVLGREADKSGIESYRKKLVDRGWTQRDVENDLRRSPEFRNRNFEETVRRVYREVLRRDPDRAALDRYVPLLRDQGWTEDKLRAQLRSEGSGGNPGGSSGDRKHDDHGRH